jgi:2-oxoglutarate ferredoxin oxidoreductase subunit alpha
MDRLVRKFDYARTRVPAPVVDSSNSKVGVIAYGSSDPAMREAKEILSVNHDTEIDYLRLRALPVADIVPQFIRDHEVVYIVEQNRDAQVATILKAEFPELATKIKSILNYNGLPLDAQTIVEGVLEGNNQERLT